MTMTDYQAALKHKYRIEPGGDSVPGVTTILGIKEKPGLMWKASEIGAITALANSRRKRTIVRQHRIWLLESGGDRASRNKKRLLAQEGSDFDVYIHFCRGEFRQIGRASCRGTG